MLLFTTCLYFLISHFLISTEPLLSESYNFYFTSEPLVKINNIFIYGSLFYKFKIAVLNNIEQISFLPTGINFYLDYNAKPHSVYFGLLYDYGFIFNNIFIFDLLYFKVILNFRKLNLISILNILFFLFYY